MLVADAQEANTIVQKVLDDLAVCIPQSGDQGVTARTAIGDLKAQAYLLLRQDLIGPPLLDCFEQVRAAGASRGQLDWVRTQVSSIATPVQLGGALMQNSCIQLCLAMEADIIENMVFTSYQDVQILIQSLTQPFEDAIEIAADEMDQMTFQGLINLAAAVVNYLVTTARPLPRLVQYEFAAVLPTLVIAYRLYADAGRADEVRDENKIIHPAFCPVKGVALSA